MGAASEAGLRVSAVVLTRNRKDVLDTVLDRLAALPIDEVVVVDNGSDDGTAASLSGRNDVRLVEAGGNLGFGARNLGAKAASHDLLLMLDDDAYPLNGAVETLAAAFAANPRLAAAGGFVRDVDRGGRIIRSTEVGTFDWWLRAGRPGAPPGGMPAFSFPEGASMLRRTAYLEAGGFFEPYFLTNSEVDLAARLNALGWEVRYFPNAAFDHLKAESARMTPEAAIYYRVRNHLWFLWLRFPAGMAARRTAGYLAFDLIESAHRGVPSAWWRGVRDAWRLRDRVRDERKPLPRDALRRAELNRGRMHVRLLAEQFVRRVRRHG